MSLSIHSSSFGLDNMTTLNGQNNVLGQFFTNLQQAAEQWRANLEAVAAPCCMVVHDLNVEDQLVQAISNADTNDMLSVVFVNVPNNQTVMITNYADYKAMRSDWNARPIEFMDFMKADHDRNATGWTMETRVADRLKAVLAAKGVTVF